MHLLSILKTRVLVQQAMVNGRDLVRSAIYFSLGTIAYSRVETMPSLLGIFSWQLDVMNFIVDELYSLKHLLGDGVIDRETVKAQGGRQSRPVLPTAANLTSYETQHTSSISTTRQ